MANEEAGSSGQKNACRTKKLSLQDVLDAVLDSENEFSSSGLESDCAESSLDEENADDLAPADTYHDDHEESAIDTDDSINLDVSGHSFGYIVWYVILRTSM